MIYYSPSPQQRRALITTPQRITKAPPPTPNMLGAALTKLNQSYNLRRYCLVFHDADQLAVTALGELHCAGLQGEQGIVAAAAYVLTGVVFGTALTDQDFTGFDLLATETLDTEALGV